jgi:hypothetical protein
MVKTKILTISEKTLVDTDLWTLTPKKYPKSIVLSKPCKSAEFGVVMMIFE